ncbi:MAG: thiamine pyrophosphate-binding protein [Pseudomonadota bacterium]
MATQVESNGTSGSTSQTQPVYEVLANEIKQLGTECVFGLMSDDTAAFAVTLDAVGVPFIGARHENAAISMAEGYAAATGGLGIAVVGRGPATANGLHASVYALRSGSQVLIIYGEAAINPGANGLGPDYKAFDAKAVLGSAGLPVFCPASPAVAQNTLRDAAVSAMSGEATALLLPIDIQAAEVVPDGRGAPARRANAVKPASQASIDVAAGLLGQSERPLIIAGRGAFHAGARAAIEQLAERTGALLATSARGKEMFDGSPYNLGIIGSFSTSVARRYIEQADCVVTFGASLNLYTTSRGMSIPKVPVVHVDTARDHIGRWLSVDVAVVGDAAEVAGRLCEAVPARAADRKPFHAAAVLNEVAEFDIRSEFQAAHTPRTMDPRMLGLALSDLLPADRSVVYDAGHFLGVVPYIKVPDPDHFKFTTDFASIGIGFGAALGFARARPDKTTVLMIGDGGLMMTLSELETVAREDLPIVIIVMNDCAYGAELHVLRPHQLPVEKSLFPDIEFADVAACFGFESATVRTLDELQRLAPMLSNPQGPVLIDCKINQEVVAPFMGELVAAEAHED